MPGRACTACIHPKINEINTLILRGVTSYRDIGRLYGLKKDALYRHRAEHIPAKMAKAADVREQLANDDLLGQARTIQEQAFGILSQAMLTNDKGVLLTPGLALRSMREAREGVRLLGEVLGKLQPQPRGGEVNVSVGVIAYMELPRNGREAGAREAALEALRAQGQLPPILIRATLPPPTPPPSSGNGAYP